MSQLQFPTYFLTGRRLFSSSGCPRWADRRKPFDLGRCLELRWQRKADAWEEGKNIFRARNSRVKQFVLRCMPQVRLGIVFSRYSVLFLFFYTHFIFYGYISLMRYVFFCAITTMSVIFGYHRSNFQVAKNCASSLHKG